jgi:urease accessory protein
MDMLSLLLADSRFPGGGHAHSGGLEEAAARGLVRVEDDLPAFLRARLHTAGALAAVFAAASVHAVARDDADWSTVDAELDARTPSSAQRAASRAQGRATARAATAMVAAPRVAPDAGTLGEQLSTGSASCPQARSTTPDCRREPVDWQGGTPPGSGGGWASRVRAGLAGSALAALLAVVPRPHHPVVLGVIVGSGGGVPDGAALAAAYLSVSGPASASVRLLGLDPLRVNAIVAALAPEVTAVAERAVAMAHLDPADLPAPGSPGLDLLAEEHDRHHREEVRLFAS